VRDIKTETGRKALTWDKLGGFGYDVPGQYERRRNMNEDKNDEMKLSRVRNVLFDLDGTLTDPGEGITRCIQFALEKLNCEVPAQSELEIYIGPPLRSTFSSILKTPDAELVEAAVGFYRERFSTAGIFENEVYAGVPLMLERLRDARLRLFVATSKVGAYAERILEHFNLASFFDGVYGSTFDGRFDNKVDLLKHLLERESLLPSETVMVGDRKHDVIAARLNEVFSLGVAYGYGTREELLAAFVDAVCDGPGEVADFLLKSFAD
jgi:phosphoglycolate phosphatase